MVNKNLDFEFEHLGKPLKKKKREREMKKVEGINIGWVHLPTGERLHLSRD